MSRADGQFKGGIKPRGGARKGAGAKPDLFKKLCKDLSSSPAFFQWAKDVFDGKPVAPHCTKDGVVHTEAGVTERTYLWEKLAAYGYGKPVSVLEVPKDGVGALPAVVVIPVKAEE